jgi:hypothetical protein
MYPSGQMPHVEQPWGFSGVRREVRSVYADSRNFYVDPNNILSSDQNTGEDPEYPLLTIARAVVLARAYKGDTIYVLSNDGWQYGPMTQLSIIESVTIPPTKGGLRLVGVGRGSMGVYWQPAVAGGTCLTINALDIEVEGFAFTAFQVGGAARGIFVNWVAASGPCGENVTIHDCTFTGSISTGIEFLFSWYPHIYNCHFQEVGVIGMVCDGAGMDFAKIHDNYFNDCVKAATLLNLSNSQVFHNRFYNVDAQNGVAATDDGLVTTGGSQNMICDNYFSCILPAAAPGDINDFCTGSNSDAWIFNHCINGQLVTTPT